MWNTPIPNTAVCNAFIILLDFVTEFVCVLSHAGTSGKTVNDCLLQCFFTLLDFVTELCVPSHARTSGKTGNDCLLQTMPYRAVQLAKPGTPKQERKETAAVYYALEKYSKQQY